MSDAIPLFLLLFFGTVAIVSAIFNRRPSGRKDLADKDAQQRSSTAEPDRANRYSNSVNRRLAKPPSKRAQVKRKQTPANPLPITDEQIARLISGLPKRTLAELQRQWLNAVRRDDASLPALCRFREALLEEWGRRAHQARTREDYFHWPSTHGGNGDGTLQFDAWNQEGMLRYLGYRVGSAQGESPSTRRRILDAIFSGPLPPVNDPEYMRSWGAPSTAGRLKRLANEIARFARHAKSKRSADMSSAIDDWEEDLSYLYREYYVRRFGFGWPSV